jgi:hypothetical protein
MLKEVSNLENKRKPVDDKKIEILDKNIFYLRKLSLKSNIDFDTKK